MDIYQGAFLVVAACAMVLFIVAVKSNSHIVLNFVLRLSGGTLLIFLTNQLLLFYGIGISVGINLYTLLTCAFLGFPGFLLLFGIRIYGFL